MHAHYRTAAAIAATAALAVGGLAVSAPTADAATYHKPGTVTVKEGRKVVRQADRQRCLTIKETQKIVRGRGDVDYDPESTIVSWNGKGKAAALVVQYSPRGGQLCADTAALVYRNGNTYAWLHGSVMAWS